MDDNPRNSVLRFSRFLSERGLNCFLKQEAINEFGDFALQANNGKIAVDVVVDRSTWFVDVRELETKPDLRYDPPILRDFLGGTGEDVVSLDIQIQIVEQYWTQIVDMFSIERRDATHQDLKNCKMQRMKRRNPKLYAEVRKFVQ